MWHSNKKTLMRGTACARARNENARRIAVGVRRRQHADARAIGIVETSGTVYAGIERCADRKRKKEQDENSDDHTSSPSNRRKRGVSARTCRRQEPRGALVVRRGISGYDREHVRDMWSRLNYRRDGNRGNPRTRGQLALAFVMRMRGAVISQLVAADAGRLRSVAMARAEMIFDKG